MGWFATPFRYPSLSGYDGSRPEPLGEAMRRRDFITVVGGAAAAWPLAALGQQLQDSQNRCALHRNCGRGDLQKELREQCVNLAMWKDKLEFEFRSAEGKPDRLPELAADWSGSKPT